MKRPTKSPRTITKESSLFNEGWYTADQIAEIAEVMRETGVQEVFVGVEQDGWESGGYLICLERYTENKEQAKERYERELRLYNAEQNAKKVNLAKKKAKVIEEAKKLGLRVVDAE